MRPTGLFVVMAVCWSITPLADRLTDKDVKALVARIEQGRDRFDDALDSKLKRGTVRDASGEVNVESFLNDFQESIDRLEERLKPDYAASAEVGALLRQASAIHDFFGRQPAGTRGESEWNRLESDLEALAAAYGTAFPLPENASVRRIGDGELAAAIDELATGSGRLKKSLDTDLKKDATVDKGARQAIVSEADQLAREAKALRNRVRDGHPSSAEAEGVLARAARLQGFISSHRVPASADIWRNATASLQSLAAAYGHTMPAR